MRELARERRRFGYRTLHVLLRRESVEVNCKRVQRLYRAEKSPVRRRGGRKRAAFQSAAESVVTPTVRRARRAASTAIVATMTFIIRPITGALRAP